MNKAIRVKTAGGPEELELFDPPVREPGPGDIRIRQEAIGVNFIDIYHRTGLYPLPEGGILGVEGAGVVEALGEGVEGLSVGQRVAYAGSPGAYATTRQLAAWRAVSLPPSVPANLAAAWLLKGLTVHMLLTRTYPVAAGSVLLVHAAAGGLGSFLTRWAKHLGATVIGSVGSDAKAETARLHGADHVIVGRDADWAMEISRLTDGRGVDFAIDGIGGDRLTKTLGCIRRFGTVASIGQAAGPIPRLAVEEIGPGRSAVFARPSVMAYAAEVETYPAAAAMVLSMIEAGIAPGIGASYPLEDAALAHLDLEAGRTAGASILEP